MSVQHVNVEERRTRGSVHSHISKIAFASDFESQEARS
jgi:hypothetical protein